jgi:hypothetical protein
MRRFIIILSVLSILNACAKDYNRKLISNKQVIVESFPKLFELDAQKLEIGLKGFEWISVIDTFLIGFDIEGMDHFLDVYNVKNHEHLGGIITKGRGLNEIMTISSENQYYTDSTGCHLWIMDNAFFSKTYCLNITKSLSSGSTVFDTSFVENNNPAPFRYIVNDSVTVGFHYSNEKQINYVKYNYLKRKVETDKNIFSEPFFDQYHRNVFAFKQAYLNDNHHDIIVASDFGLNQIYIIDPDLEKTLTIVVEKLDQTLANIIYDMEHDVVIHKYRDIEVNEDYIFALFVNKTFEEIQSENSNSGVEIHVFELNGSPIAKIKLKENIWGITIDKDRNILYGFTPFEDVFKYNLPGTLR